MKVSVIIPTYNEEETIGDCLRSLSIQAGEDVEIIVVDDGSKDSTKIKIKSLRAQLNDKNITLLEQEHKGPGEARNLGARYAKGEILVFVDADMTFEADFITKLVRLIREGETKGTFSKEEYVSNWNNIWANCWNINEGWIPRRRHPQKYPNKQKVFRALLKSEFDRVGGFDPSRGYTDDWSLSEKLGYKAQAVSGAIFYHKNPDSLLEVFKQAKWVGKRPYKLGIVGSIYALLRSSFPASICVGFWKALFNKKPFFIFFKVVYDFGVFIGIIEYLLFGKVSK